MNEKNFDLKESYEIFLKQQLSIVRPIASLYDLEAGYGFIQFLLKILPNTVQRIDNFPNETSNFETWIKDLWDKQAGWWAHSESLPNYFIDMAIIMKWLKKMHSTKNVLCVGSGPGLYELFIEHT